ncbi:hypothetical protein N9C00_02280 [Flavobacteriales bacterium]|nr:hypothetical protein [Flavobacteriales bacterium]
MNKSSLPQNGAPPKETAAHLNRPIETKKALEFSKDWKQEFTHRIKKEFNRTRRNYTYNLAVKDSDGFTNKLDDVMIDYFEFLDTNPLESNDYFKFLHAKQNGKELNRDYFKHDFERLDHYYDKLEKDPLYRPFYEANYNNYVLFIVLKFGEVWKPEFDEVFNVKHNGHRESNPLCNIPRVLRGSLPLVLTQYDIVQAYPTFIDNELSIVEREVPVYDLIGKQEFNMYLNYHSGCKNKNGDQITIEEVRGNLKVVYGDRVAEVITEERFFNKGRMYEHMTAYEESAINDFVRVNKLETYVRLHDAVFVMHDVKCDVLEFGNIKFKEKECKPPEVVEGRKQQFYKISGGKIVTSASSYKDFFNQEKFVRGIEKGNDQLILFKDTNNVVDAFNHKTETVSFLASHINELDTKALEDKIASDNMRLIQQGFQLIKSKPIVYKTDSEGEFGLAFRNGYIKINGDGYEYVNYTDVEGFFPPHRTQEHIFKEDSTKSEFELFLSMAALGRDIRNVETTTEERRILNSFFQMVGYLSQTHKKSSFTPAIILSDANADDVKRDGGRGKTLVTKAIGHVQKTMVKNGANEFKIHYIHMFADLKEDTRVYVIDDVAAGFKYEDLYTQIQGAINCQRKGVAAVDIGFEVTPKFVVTTNWAIRYSEEDASTNRRLVEFKFSDFFNIEKTPRKLFGRNLFDDWDSIEWNRFYNFIYKCVRMYIRDGIEKIEYDKNYDNFIAFFNNHEMLEQFETVFKLMLQMKSFSVGEFIAEYRYVFHNHRVDNYFRDRNTKKLIEIYTKYHKIELPYSESTRRWSPITKGDGGF